MGKNKDYKKKNDWEANSKVLMSITKGDKVNKSENDE
jgi:hypothetical protein